MSDRLGEILSEVSTEQRLKQERQRELEQLRRAAVAAVKLSNAARAKIYAPDEEPLGSANAAARNYRRAQAAKQMKELQKRQGKVEQ
jgi:hypothetical protein